MTAAPILSRELLAQALGNPRLVAAFEQQAQAVGETQTQAAETAATAERLEAASFLVLSPNAGLSGERVFRATGGVETVDEGGFLTLRASDEVAIVEGGHPVRLTAEGPTALVLPLTGALATRDGAETLTNKVLAAPGLAGLADAATDAAAAAVGVAVGGMYRNGGVLMVRLA